jgi:hypothetical protein
MLWPIYSILSAVPAITNIVGSRIEEDTIQEGLPLPYIVWSSVGGRSENYLNDLPGIDHARVQIDCYATTKASVRELALAVRNALESQAHQIGQPWTEYDSTTKVYRVRLEFSFWVSR